MWICKGVMEVLYGVKGGWGIECLLYDIVQFFSHSSPPLRSETTHFSVAPILEVYLELIDFSMIRCSELFQGHPAAGRFLFTHARFPSLTCETYPKA